MAKIRYHLVRGLQIDDNSPVVFFVKATSEKKLEKFIQKISEFTKEISCVEISKQDYESCMTESLWEV